MLWKSRIAKRAALVGLLGILTGLTLAVTGCGKNPTSYVDPTASITTTLTPTALIEASTLKQWMDEGLVNNTNPRARDKVVIVDVATSAQYGAGHIPGAVWFNGSGELTVSRLEALATLTSETPDGPSMDALIQRMGIDRYTTVVFTGATGQNFLNASRAYFTFRYWGFPRERLKVLQGGEAAWTALGQTLTTDVPVVTPSTMSVRDLYDGTAAYLSFRAPIGEMIGVIDKFNSGALNPADPNGVTVLDVRGGTITWSMANSKIDDYNQYYVAGSNATFKSIEDVTARLATFGVTASTRMTYVSCASGHRASSVFFVLDGMLRWPVELYDGSSGQWGAYITANGVGANWRVDTNSPGTTLPRTTGTPSGTLVLDPTSNAMYSSISDPRANQVAREDKAYLQSGTTAGGGGGGGGTGGGSGC